MRKHKKGQNVQQEASPLAVTCRGNRIRDTEGSRRCFRARRFPCKRFSLAWTCIPIWCLEGAPLDAPGNRALGVLRAVGHRYLAPPSQGRERWRSNVLFTFFFLNPFDISIILNSTPLDLVPLYNSRLLLVSFARIFLPLSFTPPLQRYYKLQV